MTTIMERSELRAVRLTRLARPHSRSLLVLAVLAVPLLALLVWEAVHFPFWLDEAYTLSAARSTTESFLDAARHNGGNMFGYYLLIAVMEPLGNAELTVRLPSIVAAIAMIGTTYLLGARGFDRRTGVIAAILLGTTPILFRYGAETRGYAIATLAVTVFALCLQRLLQRPTVVRAVVAAAAATTAIYFHLVAFFFVVALAAAAGVVALRSVASGSGWRSSATRPGPLAVVAAFSLTCLACAPLVVLFLAPDAKHPGWIPETSFETTATALGGMIGATSPHGPDPEPWLALARAVAVVAGAAILLRALWKWAVAPTSADAQRVSAALFSSWLLAGAGAIVVASLVRPLVVQRYFFPATPAAALVMAAGLRRVRARWLLVPATALLAVAPLAGAKTWIDYTREDWESAALRTAASVEDPADEVLLTDGSALRIPLAWYVREQGLADRMPRPLLPGEPWDEVERIHEQLFAFEDAVAEARKSRAAWVITRDAPRVDEVFESTHARTATISVDGWLTKIVRYERRATATGKSS